MGAKAPIKGVRDMDAKTFLLPLAVGGKSHIVIEQHGHPSDETFCKKDVFAGKRGPAWNSTEWWAIFKETHPKTEHQSIQRVGEVDLANVSLHPEDIKARNICGKCWKSYVNYRRRLPLRYRSG